MEKCFFHVWIQHYYLDDEFRCSSKHCRPEKHMQGKSYDYDIYSNNSDCELCKDICRNDTNCGGVDCGGTVSCTWWKVGICGSLEKQAREDSSYRTCMKYDEGNAPDLQ